jgi:hypothetical protein
MITPSASICRAAPRPLARSRQAAGSPPKASARPADVGAPFARNEGHQMQANLFEAVADWMLAVIAVFASLVVAGAILRLF